MHAGCIISAGYDGIAGHDRLTGHDPQLPKTQQYFVKDVVSSGLDFRNCIAVGNRNE
jgi:hypothetical protein